MSDVRSPAPAVDDRTPTANDGTERRPNNATPGGEPIADVPDRPNVGTTTPEAYPADQRAGGKTGDG